MPTRDLSVGEHNAVANALFESQAKLRNEAHRYRQTALPFANQGEEHPTYKAAIEQAEELDRQARAVFNLELLVRRYTVVLVSPVHIPEQC